MKSVRSLYGVCAALTAFCLLTAVVAALRFFDVAEGLSLNGWTLISFFFVGLLITGVIWLGLDWFRLRISVSSLIQKLKQRSNIVPFDTQDSGMIYNNKNLYKLLEFSVLDDLEQIVNHFFLEFKKNNENLNKQIEDLHLQLQLTERQKQNTEAIIYSLRDAVIVLDEFDKLVMANEAAGNLLCFDYKCARHQHLAQLVGEDKRPFVELLQNSRRSKIEHKKSEIQFSVKEQLRFYDCVISCVRGKDGCICGVASVMHDVTREKEISKLKNDFVSHVSHELKTPLASITAYAEMLMDGEAKDIMMQKEFYSIIQNQAQRLNRLIENILNISRIESGLVKVDKHSHSLTILMEEQLDMIRGYAEEKNVSITGQKPIIFDQVFVDKDMLSQAIVNLLSNAVKYTPSGGSVKITTEVDENESLVRFAVTDTGVGIAKDELEYVFDKFYRVAETKEKAKGTGLGLNLVKHIIENVHGGRVFAESELGVGSTFGFELPLSKSGVLESV